MPDVWGMLPKSQIDPELIEEAITRLLNAHNEDESAHLGAGQSLQSHKASEIIDHAVKSILAEKLHESAQVAECVVAASGGDYTTIQDALAAGKKRIYVKAGTYTISPNGISIASSNVELYGEDKDSTILKVVDNAASDFNIITIADNCSNIIIKGFTFDGNKAGQGAANKIIQGVSIGKTVKYVNIVDCVFQHFKNGSAITVPTGPCTYLRITDNFFNDINNYFAIFGYFEQSLIYNCVLEYSYGGIKFYANEDIIMCNHFNYVEDAIYCSSYRFLIIGNSFQNCNYSGILCTGQGDGVISSNKFGYCCMYSGAACIEIRSPVSPVSIVGNYIFGGGGYGIYINAVSYITISGNTIRYCYYDGIRLNGATYVSITGNHISTRSSSGDNTYACIFLTGTSVHNSIAGNTIYGQYYGYCIRESASTCDYNVIIGNVATGATTAQISTQGTHNDVNHNITT